jgi:ribonuclease E
LRLLRALDEEAIKGRGEIVEARAPTEVALYLLNEKRDAIAHIEESRRVRIRVTASPGLMPPDFELQSHGERPPEVEAELAREAERRAALDAAREAAEAAQDSAVEDDEELESAEIEATDGAEAAEPARASAAVADAEGAPREDAARRKRRRGRRGGRRRSGEEQPGIAREENGEMIADGAADHEGDEAEPEMAVETPASAEGEDGERPQPVGEAPRTGRRRRRRRGRGGRGGANGEDRAAPQMGESATDAGDDNAGYDDDEAPEPAEPVIAALMSFDPEPPAPAARPEMAPPVEAIVEVAAPEAAAAEPSPAVDYAPDEERRAKFFARLHRWGKKEVG